MKTPQTLKRAEPAVVLPVLGHPQGEISVEVAPNQKLVPLSPQPGQVLVHDLVPAGDFLRSVARVHDKFMRMTEDMTRKLGLGVSYSTLRRLVDAGFVKGAKIAPKTYVMSLASYYEHVKRCEADPEFWDRPENKKKWSQVCWRA